VHGAGNVELLFGTHGAAGIDALPTSGKCRKRLHQQTKLCSGEFRKQLQLANVELTELLTVDDQNLAQHFPMDDRSLLSTTLNESDVVESQHKREKSNSISQFIYARLDIVIEHCRYQRYEFVSPSKFVHSISLTLFFHSQFY
jgi:hypothetical protein